MPLGASEFPRVRRGFPAPGVDCTEHAELLRGEAVPVWDEGQAVPGPLVLPGTRVAGKVPQGSAGMCGCRAGGIPAPVQAEPKAGGDLVVPPLPALRTKPCCVFSHM